MCPPEGDAGTGMAATNSVLPRTGNVSAGTSIFAMLVLDKPLKSYYPEIDVVTTPDGGGTVAYNFLSGEPVAGAENGRPMYFRTPDGKFNLANLFRAEIYSTMAALKLGMDILFEKEQVSVDKITGHGGLFKTKGVAQQFLADGLGCAVSVMKTAGEGGAWGMALLAAYSACGNNKSLPEFLDPSGNLQPGVPVCPPEGDAGTGMAATNSVLPRTGNVSAGTSIFAMLVLEKPLKGVYEEIDVVTTPDGSPVAMVHCNNCCSELDAWVNMFGEFAKLTGNEIDKSRLYETLYKNAMTADSSCGGVTAYNCLSGEPVIKLDEGRPMYFRTPDSNLTLGSFFRAQLYSSFTALKIGMDILFDKEQVKAEKITGHGGLFKVSGVASQLMADALSTSVSVMKTAGEGGAWGMAILAAYMELSEGKKLADFLDEKVFADMEVTTSQPEKTGSEGYKTFLERYKKGLAAEKTAQF